MKDDKKDDLCLLAIEFLKIHKTKTNSEFVVASGDHVFSHLLNYGVE